MVSTEVNMAQFDVEEGEGVTLSGSVSYAGEQEGSLLFQVLTSREEGPFLEHSQDLDQEGPFSIEAPKMLGEANLVVFLDLTGDGASASDPAGMQVVEIGLSDVDGIEVEVVDDADLGGLAPGGQGEMAPPPPATDGQLARDRAFLEGQEGVRPEGEGDATGSPLPEEGVPEGLPLDGPPPEGPPPE